MAAILQTGYTSASRVLSGKQPHKEIYHASDKASQFLVNGSRGVYSGSNFSARRKLPYRSPMSRFL